MCKSKTQIKSHPAEKLRMSPSLSLILLLSILVLSISGSLARSPSADLYSTCSNLFTCGEVAGIGYPYWGGNRTVDCGYPMLELKCENDVAKITLSKVDYRVLGIYPDVRAMKLVREDYSSGLICTPTLANSTFDPTVFSAVNGYMNFTFVYGCPTTVAMTFPNQFTCHVSGIPDPGGYMIPGSLGPGRCFASVFFPIPSSPLTNFNPSQSIMASQLQQGFEVGLNMDLTTCTSCNQSSGVCGYDQATKGTTCYCSDGSSSVTGKCPSTADGPQGQTNSKGSSNKSLPIALPLAGASLAGLLVGFWIFSRRQKNMRKKAAAEAQNKDLAKTPASSKGVLLSMSSYSRTTPSYPTSKSDLEKGSTYFGVQVFSYLELEEATDNFNPLKELGDGGFGTVYYGKLQDQREVAVKRLYENNLKRVEQFMNEVEILTRMRHMNLVTLYGCTSRRSRELLLVYEYIPNGTVADHLHGKRAAAGVIPWDVRLSIAIESADALAYLHDSDVIHRDVKTNNILLDNDFRVKVADFGLSRLFPNDVTHVSTAPQGTPGYVDPEYYQCYQLTDKSDVYSFGVVLCELISSKAAVDTNRHRHDINLSSMAMSKIQNHALHELVDPSLGFETDYSVRRKATNMAELAFRCLQNEKDMRPTMREVLEALRKIERDEISLQSAEVVDIPSDETGPLRHLHPPLSPDSSTSDKWIGISSPPHSF